MFHSLLRTINSVPARILMYRLNKSSFCTHRTTKSKALGLEKLGITNQTATLYHNLDFEEIGIQERENIEGIFLHNGAFAVDTGRFTSRSPNDKYIVKQSPSATNIWWGNSNQPIEVQVFDELHEMVTTHFNTITKFYVFDGYCGANAGTRKKVRIITEYAWQHHFATNMFCRPTSRVEIQDFVPDFTIINAANVVNLSYKRHRMNSEVFIAFNIEKNLAIIGGSWYSGEIQKGIFWLMNYWMPRLNILCMHCSANKARNGDVTLFFGFSGTGKTTLSLDPQHLLVGDDEHVWNEKGIFNLEGGCYTKFLDISEDLETPIYQAIRPNALVENVIIGSDKTSDYTDPSKTSNARVSFPFDHIENADLSSSGGHPKCIIFLLRDAYCVLPLVAKLNIGQACYHFVSGYSSMVVRNEPKIIFSACFGQDFLAMHPMFYAELLEKKLREHGTQVYLVNTGWTGGIDGVRKRRSIKETRACISAILDGSIQQCNFEVDSRFGFQIPTMLGGLSYEILNPRESCSNKLAYDHIADALATRFIQNFESYVIPGQTDYSIYGPKVNKSKFERRIDKCPLI